MANPSRLEKIQITENSNSGTATKVNVQEANGEVNTQTINTGFNKNIGLNSGDVVGATTLLNQYSTTPVDWTATTFDSGQVVFYAGKQWIAKMATVAGDVPAVSSKWEEITFEALANKTVIVDDIPTDGSNNAVSSNGVFDALATKAPISSVHNPVTLGTANGLSLSNQQLSLGLASSSTTGALSGTDWNTFNGKVGGTGTNNFLTKWSGTNTVNASGAWRETSNRLANAADNGSSDFQVTGQIDLKSKNTQGDGGQLGAELLTTGSSDTSWTGTSFATGYTHSTGSVTTLTSALAPVINNLYQVAYTVTGRTAGSFTIAFGGATTAGITSSSAVGHRASTTGTLVITPTSDFNGTIVLSIKQITAGTASFVFRDNGGTLRNELRFLGGNNTASGLNALRNNTTGANNTANGVSALQNNTTGTNNTASGVYALQNNTTGGSNTANGVSALQNNTTGTNNTASGVYALQNNTTGGSNTANGVSALQNNTTGTNNTASGVYALQNNTTGGSNTANGVNAGRFISNGATSLTVANNSTFLGANTKALSDNSTNETVVGYNAIGDGNNTVSIGNTSIVSSRLRGRLLQGNVVDNSIDSGQFSGNLLATGFKTASGTASQFLKANGSVDSNTYLTSASLPTVDQTIIDGSTNAVSGNAVFDGLALKSNIGHTHVASQITDLSKASVGLGNVDNTSDLSKPLSTATINALATKAPISSVHNPVTLGTANGLSLSTQQLSLGLASSGVTGALSGTDWNTFNNKQNALTNPITGSLTTGYIPMASSTNSLSNSILRNSSGRLFNGTDDGVNTFQFTGSTRILSGNLNIDPDLALVWGATGATNFAQSYYNATSKKLIFTKSNGTNTLEIEDYSGNVNVPFNLSATTYTGGATLTGTPTAPTAPAGTNTTQVATTAFVQAAARPYKVYTALLSQTGTNAPTVIIGENTLGGAVTWSRNASGEYYADSSNLYTSGKTYVFITNGDLRFDQNGRVGGYLINTSRVVFRSLVGGIGTDGVYIVASIEIRVYN